ASLRRRRRGPCNRARKLERVSPRLAEHRLRAPPSRWLWPLGRRSGLPRISRRSPCDLLERFLGQLALRGAKRKHEVMYAGRILEHPDVKPPRDPAPPSRRNLYQGAGGRSILAGPAPGLPASKNCGAA